MPNTKKRVKSTGLPHGTFSQGDPYPLEGDYVFHGYRQNRNNSASVYERWVTREQLDEIKGKIRDHKNNHYFNFHQEELIKAAAFREKNREKIAQYQRDWRKRQYEKDGKLRGVEQLRNKAYNSRVYKASIYGGDEVVGIYDRSRTKSRFSGIEFHVDHYYPLFPKSKRYCGLNVPPNLRIIKKEENLKKSSKDPHEFYGMEAL